MTNEEKGKMIADQCLPCSEDFWHGIKQGVIIALDAEEKNLEKAEKWDKLDIEIQKFYFPDDSDEPLSDDEGGDLVDIGEAAAIAFGYL